MEKINVIDVEKLIDDVLHTSYYNNQDEDVFFDIIMRQPRFHIDKEKLNV
jgi:hypothetical protein